MINVKINLVKLIRLAVALPGCSIIFCVIISLWLHKRSSTATHCNVPNYLPSISAAVGSNTPEIYIWRMCIGFHSFLRLGIIFVYYNFYKDGIVASLSPSLYLTAVRMNCGFYILECFCLILLTDVSSIENYEIHKNGFIGFIAFSVIYMLFTCILFWKLGNLRYNSKYIHCSQHASTVLLHQTLLSIQQLPSIFKIQIWRLLLTDWSTVQSKKIHGMCRSSLKSIVKFKV